MREAISGTSLLFLLALTAFAAPAYSAEKSGIVPAGVPEGYEVRNIFRNPGIEKSAYVLLKRENEAGKEQAYVLFDGKLSGPYDAVNKIAISADGRRLAYCMKKGAREHFVIDGKESRPFDTA